MNRSPLDVLTIKPVYFPSDILFYHFHDKKWKEYRRVVSCIIEVLLQRLNIKFYGIIFISEAEE